MSSGRKKKAAGSRQRAVPTKPTVFIHESSTVEKDCSIGEGSMIWNFSRVLKGSRLGKKCKIGQNVVIGPKVRIGDNVKIQNNVSVYQGVTLEDHVFCGPSMVFTNVMNPRSEVLRMDEIKGTLVKLGASLGANCTIVCGVTIGRYGFIGAGTVVLKDVLDHALVVGNPGRQVGWMCSCGNRVLFKGGGRKGNCVACKNSFTKGKQGLVSKEA